MPFRDWTSPYRRLRAFVGSTVAIAIVVLALSAAWSIANLREEDLSRERRNADNLTKFLFESTERLFSTAEASLTRITAAAPEAWGSADRLGAILRDDRPPIRGYFFSFITDDRGVLRVGTEPGLPALSFHDFVAEGRANRGPLMVGSLNDSLGRSRRFNPILRPVFSKSGRFLGLAGIAIDPEVSTKFFAGLSDNGKLRLNVRLKRGPIFFRYPPREDLAGQNLRFLQKVYEMSEKEPSGSFIERSALQGDRAFYSFQRSEKYPVFVHIVRNVDEMESGWKSSAWGIGAMFFAAAFVLAFLGAVLWRQIARLEKEEDRRRRAEAAMSAASRMNAVGKLARGVSRDFSRLLSVMMGQAQRLEAVLPAETMGDGVQRLRKTLGRAQALIRQVEILGRDHEPEPTEVDLLARVQDLAAFARESLPPSVELKADISGSPRIRADVGRVDHILLALLSRAFARMEGRGGQLHLALRVEGGDALIAFETGRAAEGFRSGRVSEAALFSEQVMALPVAERMIRETGGRLEILDAGGPQESLIVRWPLAKSGGGDVALETRGRVLFVDREESLQTLVQDTFETLRIPVRCLTEPGAALEEIRRDPTGVSALIVDRDALTTVPAAFFDEIRGHWKELPLLMTDHRPQTLDAVPRGVIFLRKPYTAKELIGALSQASRPREGAR